MDGKQVLLEVLAFLDSPMGKEAHSGPKEKTRTVLERFLRAVSLQLGKRPQDLDGEDMRTLLRVHLPLHFVKGDPLGNWTIDVLHRYLDFLETEHVVPSLFELRNALAQEKEGFEERVLLGKGTGTGEPIGVKQETVRHRGEKVGRNDPCPCGSGRKFKKCCMQLGES